MVSYRDYQENGTLHTYGEIFIGKKLEDLTICVRDEQNDWNSKDGFMVSAPAKNREEALEISNRLMNSIFAKKYERVIKLSQNQYNSLTEP